MAKRKRQTRAMLLDFVKSLTRSEKITLQQVLIEQKVILAGQPDDKIEILDLLTSEYSNVVLTVDGELLSKDELEPATVDHAGTVFYPLTGNSEFLRGFDDDDIEDDEFDDFGNDNNEIAAPPSIFVHCHGDINEEPKFVILLDACRYFQDQKMIPAVGNIIECMEEAAVLISENPYYQISPLDELPTNEQMATVLEPCAFKVVRVNHKIQQHQLLSVTEVFLAPLVDDMPLMVKSGEEVLLIHLCPCQDPGSHDPLHIENRNN